MQFPRIDPPVLYFLRPDPALTVSVVCGCLQTASLAVLWLFSSLGIFAKVVGVALGGEASFTVAAHVLR